MLPNCWKACLKVHVPWRLQLRWELGNLRIFRISFLQGETWETHYLLTEFYSQTALKTISYGIQLPAVIWHIKRSICKPKKWFTACDTHLQVPELLSSSEALSPEIQSWAGLHWVNYIVLRGGRHRELSYMVMGIRWGYRMTEPEKCKSR